MQEQQTHPRLGFNNPGNRCYLNSVIVALLHVPKFKNWIQHHWTAGKDDHKLYIDGQFIEETAKEEDCVAYALATLSSEYWSEPPNARELAAEYKGFLSLIDHVQTSSGQRWTKEMQSKQQDAPEFFNWLLTILREQFQQTKHKQEADEYQLYLPCDGHGSIDDALEASFAIDERIRSIRHTKTCKKQQRKQQCVKKIMRGPDILCTQFNRFSPKVNEKGQQQSDKKDRMLLEKNERHVLYDEILDLSQFVENETPLRYRLIAVVHHYGEMRKGHCICHARTSLDNWACYDDARVSSIDAEQARQPGDNFTPYLLFWQKEPLSTPSPPFSSPPATSELPGSTHPPTGPPTTSSNTAARAKKRSREEVHDADGEGNGRSGSKSPRNGDGTRSPSAEQKLAECRREHERKDKVIANLKKEIEKQKTLICRSALRHIQLIDTVSEMNVGLHASKRAIAIISRFFQRLEARGDHPKIVKSFMEARNVVKNSQAKNKRLAKESEQYAKLIRVLEDPNRRNSDIEALLKGCKEAKKKHELVPWLEGELDRLDLPEEIDEGDE
ncbi:MAG: hypothetical protein Q9201_003941 [Fulgogasparrea decipioides]